MRLLLDAGNSRFKWRLQNDRGEILGAGVCAYDALEPCLAALAGKAVAEVLVSSVRGEDFARQLNGICLNFFAVTPEYAHVKKTWRGLTAAYEDVAALGVDRWLAMLAAVNDCGAALVVIDAGTAITVDFIDGGGQHVGGLIVPGVQALARSLFANTDAVRVESLTLPQIWQPGCDTLSCVEQGVAAAFKGLMQEVVAKARHISSDATIYLTGGDAEQLRPWLPSSCKLRAGLVFDGLLLSQ